MIASQGHYDQRIRRVEIATGATTTLAGSGTRGYLDGAGGSARFYHPRGIAIEPSGGYALVAVRVPLAWTRCIPWTVPATRHPVRQRTRYGRLHTDSVSS